VARLEAQDRKDPMPLPALGPLAAGIDEALVAFGVELGAGAGPGAVPPLRELYAQLASGNGDGAGAPDLLLLVQLDEMVDATNTAAGLLGLRAGVSPE